MADSRTYFRVADDIDENPKMLAVSNAAFRLDMHGISYCSRNLTDGSVPKAMVPRLMASPTRKLVAELIDAGRWIEHADHYEVHDYLEHQRSAEEVVALKTARREAGRRGGQASAQANAQANAKQGPQQNGSKSAASTKAEAKAEAKAEENQVRVAPTDDPLFDAFWTAYPERRGKKLGERKARVEWARLGGGERERALVGAPHYAADANGHAQDAHNWLRERAFEEWQEPAKPKAPSNGSAPYTNPPGAAFEDTRV